MSVRFINARVCAFFILACSYTHMVSAEELSKKATIKNQVQDKNRSKPALVIQYSSVFDNYVPFDNTLDIGWKEANDKVGQIGGWRAYGKLVQEEAEKKAELENQDKGDDKR